MLRNHIHFGVAGIMVLGAMFLLPETKSFTWYQPAAVFMVDNVRAEDLRTKYTALSSVIAGAPENVVATIPPQNKVRIFLMPGHEPDYGGAEYRTWKERDMVLAIGTYLEGFLATDPHYSVILGRDKRGWNPNLISYFATDADEINEWRKNQAAIMKKLVSEGEIEVAKPIPHQTVTGDVAFRLYGINKWIGENNFDLALHLHINDYGSRRVDRPGEFTGYAIYVPERQYSNSAAAKMVAESIAQRLSLFWPKSNQPRESAGIVEDQELVALGRYNTADVPSILVEYGYIYETQFEDPIVRDAVLKEYAYQTYLGLNDFFASGRNIAPLYETVTLPHDWSKDIRKNTKPFIDAFALQIALRGDELYPQGGDDLHECPISGVFGNCTKTALDAFQKRYEINGEVGFVGEKTRDRLRTSFAQ